MTLSYSRDLKGSLATFRWTVVDRDDRWTCRLAELRSEGDAQLGKKRSSSQSYVSWRVRSRNLEKPTVRHLCFSSKEDRNSQQKHS